jgi:phosphomannomutase
MIRFGTDGWRGVISEDFTFANVRLVAEAIANYLIEREEAKQGVVIGYDARFLSREYAAECAAMLAAKGIQAQLAQEMIPTPALTWAVKDRQAALGIMITASHNPPVYNGLKIKMPYGGSATPEVTAAIEGKVRELEGTICSKPSLADTMIPFHPGQAYLDHVKTLLSGDTLRKLKGKVIFEVMYGSAQGYPARLAENYGIELTELHSEINPSFGGIYPEPIEKNLGALRAAVLENKAVVGLATDGDGDRIAAIDQDGRYITAYQIIALLTRYLVEQRGWSGGVVQSLSLSELVKGVVAKYGLKIYETPVGFKHIAELMLQEDILIGGEEAGGIGIKNYIPERDGLLLGFLLMEVVAAYGKTLGQLLDEMSGEFGRYFYGREDVHLSDHQKAELLEGLSKAPPKKVAGFEVIHFRQGDGWKFTLPNGWVIFRVSGTEPILRIYSEMTSPEALRNVLAWAVSFAQGI